MLFSLGFAMLVAIVVGVVLIYSRRRSTQQEALLWALATAAGREMPLAPTLEAFASQSRGRYRRKVMSAAQILEAGSVASRGARSRAGAIPARCQGLDPRGERVGRASRAAPRGVRDAVATQRPWLAVGIRIVYLCWVTFVLQSVIAFISYFILPKFEAIFADFGAPLPSVTIAWIEITHFFIVYWPILLLLMLIELGLLMLGSVAILGIPPWYLPLIDRLFIRRHSALIFRCLARVVEGKRPLAQGLATLARTYPMRWIRRRLEEVARDINAGDDWCESLARHGLIRPAEAALLEAAKRVGNLPWALRQAAENSERRLAYRFQFGSSGSPAVRAGHRSHRVPDGHGVLHPAGHFDPETRRMMTNNPSKSEPAGAGVHAGGGGAGGLPDGGRDDHDRPGPGLGRTRARGVERRQWAIQEVANLMERLTAAPWDRVTPESAARLALSEAVRAQASRARADDRRGRERRRPGEKRLAIRLRWRNRAGAWEAPVRLTAWIARQRSAR